LIGNNPKIINGYNSPYEPPPTSVFIDKNKADISISIDTNRLIFREERRNLVITTNVDAITEKLTNKQILEEKNLNKTKREPFLVVS
jgi:hypothetical protein